MVVLEGEYFEAVSWCRFDSLVTPGRFVSSTRILCTAPAHVAGSVEVATTSNQADYFGVGTVYEYVRQVIVRSVSPAAGPTTGEMPMVLMVPAFLRLLQ